jgi:hypothetical protein
MTVAITTSWDGLLASLAERVTRHGLYPLYSSAADYFNGLLARLAARCASFPDRRVLLGVHDRDDVNESRIEAIQNGVGEALDKLSAQISVDDRRHFGTGLNPVERDADVVAKSFSESFSTVLVETKGTRASASASALKTTRVTTRFETSWRERLPRAYQLDHRDRVGPAVDQVQPVVHR